MATTSFVCFLSTLVRRTDTVQNMVALSTFLCAVLYIAFLSLPGSSDALKFALCVVPMFAAHFIGDRMVVLEGNNRGLTWETVTESFPLSADGGAECTLLWVAFYMLLSCVFWVYQAWYVSHQPCLLSGCVRVRGWLDMLVQAFALLCMDACVHALHCTALHCTASNRRRSGECGGWFLMYM